MGAEGSARLVAVDVGNTHVVVGVFSGEALVVERRFRAAPHRTADELTPTLLELFGSCGMRDAPSVLGCVVPSIEPAIALALSRTLGRAPLVASTDPPLMPIEYEDPRTLGVDRYVNALAAYERVKGAVVVVDLGTATKIECVSSDGRYLGGAIAPGLRASAELLSGSAARLPSVALERPRSVVGRTTTASLASGLVFGWAGLVEGLVARAREELGEPAKVIATGGLCRVVAADVAVFDEVVPSLTLEGLRLLWLRRHRS